MVKERRLDSLVEARSRILRLKREVTFFCQREMILSLKREAGFTGRREEQHSFVKENKIGFSGEGKKKWIPWLKREAGFSG